MIFEVEQRIAAPVDTVWRYLTDPDVMGDWMPGIQATRSRDGGPLVLNSRLLFSARGADRTSDVVAYEVRRLITLRSTQGPITATYEYSLRPEEGPAPNDAATIVTLKADCVAKGPARLITPLLRPLIRRADQGQLRLLKSVIDRSHGGHLR